MTSGNLGKEFKDGEIIFHQGEAGSFMYIIQEGCVEVFLERDGNIVSLRLLKSGDFLGEMALFTGERRSTNARACGRTRLLTVDKRNFMRRIQEDPTIAFRLVQALIGRIQALNEDVAVLSRTLQECIEELMKYEKGE